ncbi:MAG: flagellar basal body-associated FliL family protein [Gammaproteobacteria bacterium]|nr:flagellar basal body-associated FliL family protein [Marinobacter nitratireducens]TNE73696.1 MAG: flagellar basal body-associated FliL family protein [Gammaproteobacteria bacterium]TNE98500.1 MAG: flagellar basal body-associated FliL family protein [Gammaproteobacteria bacterium]
MRLRLKSSLTLMILLTGLCALPTTSAASENEEEPVSEEAAVTDYIAMEPAFVTHVGAASSKVTYLKASVSLRTSTPGARPAVEAHMPRLRHELVMLFGEQTSTDSLTTMEGQQALREEAKKRINKVLEDQHTGESITGVLFTEFVVQK